jgi:cell division protein YceG involved in septum cleavage
MRLAGILLVVILVMGGVGYWYYNDTQARMAILQDNNAKLEIAVETNEAALESLQVSYASAQQENTRLNEAYTSIRRQNQALADKLQQIDLTAAAIANAESIERAVNRGTLNAGRCFELLSGAELNEKERNAENDIAFNKECPWLYDTYKSRGLLNTATAD